MKRVFQVAAIVLLVWRVQQPLWGQSDSPATAPSTGAAQNPLDIIDEWKAVMEEVNSASRFPDSQHGRLKQLVGKAGKLTKQVRALLDDGTLKQYVASLAARKHALEVDLQGRTGQHDNSYATVEAAMAPLEQQLEALELEQAGDEAKKSALEQAIDVQSREAAGAMHDDPVVGQLQKLVDLRDQQVKKIEEMQEKGMNTPADILSAQADLVEARVKLAERQQAARGSTELLASLNSQLVEIVVRQHEQYGKKEWLYNRVGRLRAARDTAYQLNDVTIQESKAESEQGGLMNDLIFAEQNLQAFAAAPSTSPGN